MALRRHMIGGLPRGRQDAGLVVRGIFADDEAIDRARSWARSVLGRRRIDPARTPLRASRSLRAEDPRLTLAAARWLIAHLQDDPADTSPGEASDRRRPGQLR